METEHESGERAVVDGAAQRRGKQRALGHRKTHGIFCKQLVLPGENRKLFHEIREQTIVALRPQDVVEMMIVDTIVAATWKLRRLQNAEFFLHESKVRDLEDAVRKNQELSDERRGELVKFTEQEKIPAALTLSSYLESECGTSDRLTRYEQRLHYTRHRAMRELREHRKTAGQASQLPPSPFRETATSYDIDERIGQLDKMLRDPHAFLRNLKPRRSGEADAAAASANPENFETGKGDGSLLARTNA